jgi:hypothetical protein
MNNIFLRGNALVILIEIAPNNQLPNLIYEEL